MDYTNKFAIDFMTDLLVNLSDATKFEEHAKIVRTWTMTLPPGSFWEFNLHHHLVKGFYLNRINDLSNQSGIRERDVLQIIRNLFLKDKDSEFRKAVDRIVKISSLKNKEDIANQILNEVLNAAINSTDQEDIKNLERGKRFLKNETIIL